MANTVEQGNVVMFYKAFAKLYCLLLFAAIATCSHAKSVTGNEIVTLLIEQSKATPGRYALVIENTDFGNLKPPMNMSDDTAIVQHKVVIQEVLMP